MFKIRNLKWCSNSRLCHLFWEWTSHQWLWSISHRPYQFFVACTASNLNSSALIAISESVLIAWVLNTKDTNLIIFLLSLQVTSKILNSLSKKHNYCIFNDSPFMTILIANSKQRFDRRFLTSNNQMSRQLRMPVRVSSN